jgi:hypothetical protein
VSAYNEPWWDPERDLKKEIDQQLEDALTDDERTDTKEEDMSGYTRIANDMWVNKDTGELLDDLPGLDGEAIDDIHRPTPENLRDWNEDLYVGAEIEREMGAFPSDVDEENYNNIPGLDPEPYEPAYGELPLSGEITSEQIESAKRGETLDDDFDDEWDLR